MGQEVFIKESPGFVCDFMLGRLAKWLRLLGFDTLYYKSSEGKAIIYYNRKENRTILTRNESLAEKCEDAILIESENLMEQLKQMSSTVEIENPFSRCPVCNTEIEEVEKETIKNEVPPYIFEVHDEFKKCPECGRVFWKGTHYGEIKKVIDEISA